MVPVVTCQLIVSRCAPALSLIGIEPIQHPPVAPPAMTAADSGVAGTSVFLTSSQPLFGQAAPLTVTFIPVRSAPSGSNPATLSASVTLQSPVMNWKYGSPPQPPGKSCTSR